MSARRRQIRPIRLVVLDGGLTEKAWQKLETTARMYNRHVEFRRERIAPGRFSGLRPLNGSLLPYARLLLPDLLPEERVVYVDTDILFLKDVVDLWNMSLDGAASIAVQNRFFDTLSKDCPWLNGGDDGNCPYFNSGIMLIDLGLWRRLGIHERALDLATREPEKCRFWDQTVLNYVLRGQVKIVDRSWNTESVCVWNWWPDDLFEDGGDHLEVNIHYVTHKPWLTYQPTAWYQLWYRFHDVWCGTRWPAVVEYGLTGSWLKRSVMRSLARRRATRGALAGTLWALGRDWSLAPYGTNGVTEATVRRVAGRWQRDQQMRMEERSSAHRG